MFHTSNNEAEYEALIAGLRLAHSLKICSMHAYCDSQLVPCQNLAQSFDQFALTRIPRAENALAALASSSGPGLRRVIPI